MAKKKSTKRPSRVQSAKKAAGRDLKRAKVVAQKQGDRVRAYAQKNPGKTAGIAAGVGAALGALASALLRRKK